MLGKHSGAAAVRWAYSRMGIPLEDPQIRSILDQVRTHASRAKCEPSTGDLLRFFVKSLAGTDAFLDGAPGRP